MLFMPMMAAAAFAPSTSTSAEMRARLRLDAARERGVARSDRGSQRDRPDLLLVEPGAPFA
jgi:hypothetical protein